MVTPRMGSSLGGFQDQMARRLTGRLPRQKPDGKWKYTSTATAKARYEVGFQTMGGYIRIQQKKVSHYIDTLSLIDLCEGSERAPGARVGMVWWDQTGINLVGARETAAAAAENDGGEEWRMVRKGRLPGRSNSIEYT